MWVSRIIGISTLTSVVKPWKMRLAPSLLEVASSFLYVRIINLYTKKDSVTINRDDANLIHLKPLVLVLVGLFIEFDLLDKK
jgi:hypothetical protein